MTLPINKKGPSDPAAKVPVLEVMAEVPGERRVSVGSEQGYLLIDVWGLVGTLRGTCAVAELPLASSPCVSYVPLTPHEWEPATAG